MRAAGVWLLLLLLSLTVGTAGGEEADMDSLAQGNNRFALELYDKLRAGEGNLFLSPHSISTALAMTYAGAGADRRRDGPGPSLLVAARAPSPPLLSCTISCVQPPIHPGQS
jgi:hypothetical protein